MNISKRQKMLTHEKFFRSCHVNISLKKTQAMFVDLFAY
jgi:hypothetical protein